MPHGGSITLFSMVPIRGNELPPRRKVGRHDRLSSTACIQLVQGLGNLAYCQTLTAQVGCVLLDYLLAFTVLGFACLIAKPLPAAAPWVSAVSAFVVCLLRFLCSFLSGVHRSGRTTTTLSAG